MFRFQVADQLKLERKGPQHQAGSDSLLTGIVFFKMKEMYFEDNIDDSKYCGYLYGLGTTIPNNNMNVHNNQTNGNATSNNSSNNGNNVNSQLTNSNTTNTTSTVD